MLNNALWFCAGAVCTVIGSFVFIMWLFRKSGIYK